MEPCTNIYLLKRLKIRLLGELSIVFIPTERVRKILSPEQRMGTDTNTSNPPTNSRTHLTFPFSVTFVIQVVILLVSFEKVSSQYSLPNIRFGFFGDDMLNVLSAKNVVSGFGYEGPTIRSSICPGMAQEPGGTSSWLAETFHLCFLAWIVVIRQ